MGLSGSDWTANSRLHDFTPTAETGDPVRDDMADTYDKIRLLKTANFYFWQSLLFKSHLSWRLKKDSGTTFTTNRYPN
jgi:hypothetical protein